MANVKRKVEGARLWLTKAKESLSQLLGVEPVDKFALEDAVNEFDLKLKALEEAQEAFEMEVELTKLFEVIRGGADNSIIRGQFAGNQTGILQICIADCDIKSTFHQINYCVGQT